jgi:hypothetical protein
VVVGGRGDRRTNGLIDRKGRRTPDAVGDRIPKALRRRLKLCCVTHDIVVRHVAPLAIDAIRSEGNIEPMFNAEREAHVVQRPLGMLVCALLLIPGAVAAQTKLEDSVNQAVTILERFREIPEQAIPEAVMRDAKGLAILTVLKAGFLFRWAGRARSRRRPDEDQLGAW